MKKRTIIILAIIAVILISTGSFLYFKYLYSPSELTDVQLQSDPACEGIQDDYITPDFDALKTKLSSEKIIQDTPENSKIIIMFYHIVENCRFIDEIYLLRDGEIQERNVISDVEMLISSDYVDDLLTDDLCDVISKARDNGDISQSSNTETSKLMWTYKSMLEYRECLGV